MTMKKFENSPADKDKGKEGSAAEKRADRRQLKRINAGKK